MNEENIVCDKVSLIIDIPEIGRMENTECGLSWDKQRNCPILDNDDVRRILSDTLMCIEHIFTAQPTLWVESSDPNVWRGLVSTTQADMADQLHLVVQLNSTTYFWISSAMQTYGITAILENQTHGLQKPIFEPAIVWATNTALKSIME